MNNIYQLKKGKKKLASTSEMNDEEWYDDQQNVYDKISKLDAFNIKRARMKKAGTYCDDEEPEMSFLNWRPSCKDCPNYKECKKESENSSRAVLQHRRKKLIKQKSKRKRSV
jgi:hypothetical protein